MNYEPHELTERLRKIRAVITDIDGVLTNGCVGYGLEEPVKFFNYRDGHWIKMALRENLIVGFLSGKKSLANARRAAELGVTFCYEDAKDKLATFSEILSQYQLSSSACLYLGDDVIDLPVLRRVGVAVTPADGLALMEDFIPVWRTSRRGGEGVLQEVIEAWLRANGRFDAALERYCR